MTDFSGAEAEEVRPAAPGCRSTVPVWSRPPAQGPPDDLPHHGAAWAGRARRQCWLVPRRTGDTAAVVAVDDPAVLGGLCRRRPGGTRRGEAGSQRGWWKTLSSSRCGTPSVAASSLASVDLPEPEFPTTETRRTNADHSTVPRAVTTSFPQPRRTARGGSLPGRSRNRNSLSTGGGQFGRDIHRRWIAGAATRCRRAP